MLRLLNSNLGAREEHDYRSCSNGIKHGPLGTRPVAAWVDAHGIYWCAECMDELGADPNRQFAWPGFYTQRSKALAPRTPADLDRRAQGDRRLLARPGSEDRRRSSDRPYPLHSLLESCEANRQRR